MLNFIKCVLLAELMLGIMTVLAVNIICVINVGIKGEAAGIMSGFYKFTAEKLYLLPGKIRNYFREGKKRKGVISLWFMGLACYWFILYKMFGIYIVENGIDQKYKKRNRWFLK